MFGVSSDDADSHADFAEQNSLPYPLLTDANDEVRSLYGIPADLFGFLKGRQTFVIDAEGVVQMVRPRLRARRNTMTMMILM